MWSTVSTVGWFHLLPFHLCNINKLGAQVKGGRRQALPTATSRSQVEEESGIEREKSRDSGVWQCNSSAVCVFKASPSRQSRPALYLSPISPSVVVSCCCTLCNPLTEKTRSSSIMPFPSRRHCTYCSMHCTRACSKPFLSTAARSHPPVSNLSVLLLLKDTSKPLLTRTLNSTKAWHCNLSPLYSSFSDMFCSRYTCSAIFSILLTASMIPSGCLGVSHSSFFVTPHLAVLRSCCTVLSSALSSRHSCWWRGTMTQTCKRGLPKDYQRFPKRK